MWKKKLAKINKQLLHGVCIHHSCTRTIEQCRKALKSRKCSTNVIIEKNGNISVERTNPAAACVGFNSYTVQIDLIGNFETRDTPTLEQLQSLRNVIEYLCEKSGLEMQRIPKGICKMFIHLGDEGIRGAAREYLSCNQNKFFVFYHGEVRPTKCCGRNLIMAIDAEYR